MNPSLSDIRIPRTNASFQPWRSGDPYQHAIPKDSDPWGKCFQLVQHFDDEMCKAWREEVDTLLVFAGLFSAAVTAFTVESYRWLQDDPAEISNRILVQISTQLNNLSSSSNSSLSEPSSVSFNSSPPAIRINALWFTSLTLSLTSVLIGILCKQWLREYQRHEGLSPKDAFPVRQMRYEGLISWHVPKILSSLPLLLQAALVLFFGGLLDLLWTLNSVVASIVTAVVGLALLLLLATTALPCLQYLFHFSNLQNTEEPHGQCAYKSPQSWAFHLFGTWLASVYGHFQMKLWGGTAVNYLRLSLWLPDSNWVKYDLRWQSHGTYIERGISWIDQNFTRNIDAIYHIYNCLGSMENDVAARCVSRIIEDTWDPLVPLVDMLLPTFQRPETHDEPVKSITKDLILTGYLVIHHRADEKLSIRCIEQCIRFINTATDEIQTTSIVFEVLYIVLSSTHPSDELYEQLLASVRSLFVYDRVTNLDVATFWNIFNLLRLGANGGLTDRPAFVLLEDVSEWLQRSVESDLQAEDKNFRIMKCLKGMTDMYWSLRAQAQIDQAKGLVGFDRSESLVRLLDHLAASLPEGFLSSWAMDTWQLAKEEFLSIPQDTVGDT